MVNVTKYIADYQPLNVKLGILRQIMRLTRQDEHIKRAGQSWARCEEPLDDARLRAHLNGGPYVGIYPMLPGTEVTKSAACDLDDHDKTLDPQKMRDVARQLIDAARAAGLCPMVVRSGGGRGIHIWFRWDEDQSAAAVRALFKRLIESIGFKEGASGGIAAGEIEIFPKQARVAAGGQGNGIALPFGNKSVPLDPNNLDETTTIEWRASKPVPFVEQAQANGLDHDEPLTVEKLTEQQKTDLRSALKYLCDQGHSDNYDEWVKTLLALQNADCGLELYHEFSKRSAKYDEEVAQKKWDDNLGSAHTPWRTIFARAQEVGWKNPESVEAKTKPIDLSPLTYQSSFDFHESKIPERDWVLKGLLLRKHLTMLVAPPGTGKSLISLQLAIALATGKPWADWKPIKPSKVLVLNTEDDIDEMNRRIFAACKHMGVARSELNGRLFVVNLQERGMVMVRRDPKTKEIVDTGFSTLVVDICLKEGIDVAVVDPLVETHNLNENDQTDAKSVAVVLRQMSRDAGVATMAIHHTPKGAANMAGNADAGRGAGAFQGVARVLATLFPHD